MADRRGYQSSDRKVTDLANPPSGPAPGAPRTVANPTTNGVPDVGPLYDAARNGGFGREAVDRYLALTPEQRKQVDHTRYLAQCFLGQRSALTEEIDRG